MSVALPDLLAETGDAAGDTARAVFESMRAAGNSDEMIQRSVSLHVAMQNSRGGAIGEGAARTTLAQWGELARSGGPLPRDLLAHSRDRGRLGRAVGTVLGTIDPAEVEVTAAIAARAIHRLARSEAVEAAQTAFRSTMTRSGRVKGWTRQLEGDACELCVWWGRQGRVWPAAHPLQTHTGCTCAQTFVQVSQDDVEPVAASESAADRAARIEAKKRETETPAETAERERKRRAVQKRLQRETDG